MTNKSYIIFTSLIVALGGFLLGFDASVISGAVPFIEEYFELNKIQLGWSVSSLTLASTLAMLAAGPLSDKYGRKKVLMVTALLFTLSAIASAIATQFWFFVIARMIGGAGVGVALLVAPMYIAEIAPPNLRGSMVSLNQFTIVFGISVAYFSNYFLLDIGEDNWRWMLGVETIPAALYFFFLLGVPESPRWLAMKGQDKNALKVMIKANGEKIANEEFQKIKKSIKADEKKEKANVKELFGSAMKTVMIIAVVIAFFQQATGINAIFYYAPMIFEQTGIGRDASFVQAIIIGLTNFVFTLIAVWFIDRIGRKPLLLIGLAGMAIFLIGLSIGFKNATYQINEKGISELQAEAKENNELAQVMPTILELQDKMFDNDLAFKAGIINTLGQENAKKFEGTLRSKAISINSWLILICIIGFVATFAISIGPIIWVLLSELFPNRLRGMAVSFSGFINSVVAFTVVLIFPWELDTLGNFGTFLIFGILGIVAWVFVYIKLPETKGKSLEEIEAELIN